MKIHKVQDLMTVHNYVHMVAWLLCIWAYIYCCLHTENGDHLCVPIIAKNLVSATDDDDDESLLKFSVQLILFIVLM